MNRDQLLAALWDERHNSLWWTTNKPARIRAAVERDLMSDDDITTARRRRELLAAVDHHTIESEAQ